MSLDPGTAGRLKGLPATVVVIPVTPMRPDGSIEWGTYANLIRRVVDSGISRVLPERERNEVAEILRSWSLTRLEARL
jgi:hypothetical protein